MKIPYGKQKITEADKQAVLDCLESDFLTQGPKVAEFEHAFCEAVGSQEAIAVTNGTAALHLVAKALGVEPGQKVLVTPNSFVATANCIHYCGGEVEFVDIHPDTYCMDLNQLDEKLYSAGKMYAGIVVVDFAGHPVDMERLRSIADKHGLWVVQDSCHAIGAEFQKADGNWSKVGSCEFSDASTFSFHPVKHVATGEGGMITTNIPALAQKVRDLRTHGITKNPERLGENHGGWYYEMQDEGLNYRLPDVLCALGTSQLSRLSENLEKRRAIASKYDRAFEFLPIKTPLVSENLRHAYHLYVVLTDQRKELYDFLRERGIFSQVHYIPIYQQPYFINKYGKQSFVNCDDYYSRCLSLPMFHSMTDAEQDYVIQQVSEFFQR